MDNNVDNLIDDIVQKAPTNKQWLRNKRAKDIERHRRDKKLYTAPNKIVERVTGEVVPEQDAKQFKEAFHCTWISILEEYQQNNPDKVRKPPHEWYNDLLIELKHNTPKLDIHNLDILEVVWEELGELLYKIGLYPTQDIFLMFIGSYFAQFKKLQELNPKYKDFSEKMQSETIAALKASVASNPNTQVGKMFLLKTMGVVEQTQPKQIEVNHHIQQYDNIAGYRLEDSQH